jgi:hypothetical protein
MRIVNMKRVLALMLVTGAMFAGRAEAAAISIQPNTVTANVGDTINFDVVVALGAAEAVGGVDIRVTVSNLILDDVSFTIDPDNKMGAEFDFGSGFGANFVEFVFLAEDFFPLDQFTTLKAMQGAGFRIATFSLLAEAEGIAELNFSTLGGYLSDANGDVLLGTTVDDGLVCIGSQFAGRCQAVPEPGLLSLFAAGLVTAAVRRRQSKR